MNVQPFSQVQGATQAIVPSASSQSLTLTGNGVTCNCILVSNKSTIDIAFRVGLASSGPVTALLPVPGTPGDCIVLAGSVQVFSKGFPIDTIAIIGTGSATGNVYVTPGEGH
jgi:hypothetical protein